MATTNLSKIKRQRMLSFLVRLRDDNRDNENALKAINEIENELNEKKYGLVWEEHSERVDEMMVENVPILLEDKSREIPTVNDDNYNFLIEGDNLHSLKLLEKTHREKIDVIYIDPPYNTGKDSFEYDDKKVDTEDGYRHSKWLSFMKRRLVLAKELLSEHGAIFMSIDDNELATLKLLCDSIFGDTNFVGNFIVENNPKGRKNGKFISVTSEYCLIYVKDFNTAEFKKTIPKEASDMAKDENGNFIRRSGKRVLMGENSLNKSVTDFKSKKHYTAYIKGQSLILKKEKLLSEKDEALIQDGYARYITYLNDHFVENTYTEQKFTELFKKGALDIRKDKIYEKHFSDNKQIKGLLTNISYDAIYDNKKVRYEMDLKTTSAKRALYEMMGAEIFTFPKNVNFIKHLINLNSNNDSIILDFFAGSGTTAQAVLELNKEDGGNRKFILCTNNESNICSEVTYPRVKTVITGMRPNGSKYSDGIPANLKYYKTAFVAKDSETFVDELIAHTDEMIQLEYGVKIDKNKYISVLTDEDADTLFKNWAEFPNIRAIYISRHVILNAERRELFHTKDVYVIPDYYYRKENRWLHLANRN